MNTADWLHPPAEEDGLRRYVDTIRERIWFVIVAVLVTTAASVAYVLTAAETYEAQSEMLVNPVSKVSDREALAGLPLIFAVADPRRDLETAAQFVTNLDVANKVRDRLGLEESARALLGEVKAEPVAKSNIVAVTGRGDSPEEARDLANAFAKAAAEDRTEQVHAAIDRQLPAIRAQLESTGSEAVTRKLEARLAQLETLRGAPDSSLRVETLAQSPEHAAWPRPMLTIAGGLLAGLVLGIAAAFTAHALDPRLRREEQLRRLYALPILGRVPRESSLQPGGPPIGPRALSAAGAAAFGTLRGTLEASGSNGEGESRAILVTGASPSEGKSTTAVNLASALALAGNRVILIDADLRRPSLAGALQATPARGGVVSVMTGKVGLRDALTESPSDGQKLQLLLADHEGGSIEDLPSISARTLIEEARQIADYVIIDGPPINEVVDALPLAREADDVLIVVRIGKTRLDKLAQLGELLSENGIRPAGFAVIGVPPPGRRLAQYYHRRSEDSEERSAKRPSTPRLAPPERSTAGIDLQRWGMGLALAILGVPLGVLAGLDPQISIVAALALAFALIAFTDLAMGLGLYVIANFLFIIPFGLYGGLARLLLGLAWLALVLARRRPEREFPAVYPIVAVALFLFVGWAFLSVAWAQDTPKALADATRYALSALVFLIAFTAMHTRRDITVVLTAFLVGAVAAVIYGFAAPTNVDLGQIAGQLANKVLDPNQLAAVLLSGVAMAVALIALDERPSVRVLTAAAAALSGVGVLLTASRSAMIALVVSLLATIVLAGRWRIAILMVSVVAAAGTYAYFTQFAPEEAQERISKPLSGAQRSEDGRSTIWLLAWRAFQDEPLTGVGAGNFPVVQVRYLLRPGVERAEDQVIDDPEGKVAHSAFLSVLSELGLVGFVLFMFVIGFGVLAPLRAARLFAANGDTRMQVVANSIAVALIGYLALQNFHSEQANLQLWLLLALGSALLAMARREAAPVRATSVSRSRPSYSAPRPSAGAAVSS